MPRTPAVARLAFGHLDFQLDVGMQCAANQAPLQRVRSALVLASRRAGGAAPIDGVTADKDDMQTCQSDARHGRQGGFGGKLCIRPARRDLLNEAFSSSEEELAWALRVLDAARCQASGVFSLDGRMVDAPVVAAARVVFDRAAG